jgi:hypothetical protein
MPYAALGDYDQDTELLYFVGIVDWSDPDNVVVLWESDSNLITFR